MIYTLYYVHVPMGYFERADEFDALNDQVALSICERKASDQPLELWCGGRLVKRIDPALPEIIPPFSERAA